MLEPGGWYGDAIGLRVYSYLGCGAVGMGEGRGGVIGRKDLAMSDAL